MGLCISSASSQEIEGRKWGCGVAGFENNTDVILHLQEININGDENPVAGSLHTHQGSKGLNQDAAILHQGQGVEGGVLCGVFDGHGKNGHIVSKLVRDRLLSLLLNQKKAVSQTQDIHLGDPETGEVDRNSEFLQWHLAFTSAFKAMDKEIKLLDDVDCSVSGTTAVVVVKQGEDLVIANLGDSRAVLARRTEMGIETSQLTTDMKPDLPDEANRIKMLNGRVFALEQERHVQRVWMPEENYPGLAMTRAFGDFDLKKHGVVSIPDVSLHRVGSEDQFLVLATDGVWDVLSNDEVAAIVWGARSEEEAAKAVVDEARLAWKRRFSSAKSDDCTAACLFFHKK